MEWDNDDEVLFSDIQGTVDEVYDPWDEIIEKLDNGETL